MITYDENSAPHRWVRGMDLEITYYLAGPMAGYPDHNFPAFVRAAEILRNTGLKIVTPVEINPTALDWALDHPDEYSLNFLRSDIQALISECDGLILMSGWPKSRGAKAELGIALDLEYPIYYYDNFQIVSMQ